MSEELKTTRENSDVIGTFALLPPGLWNDVEEVAQLRVEQKVIKSIEAGKADRIDGELLLGSSSNSYTDAPSLWGSDDFFWSSDDSVSGALGTWSTDFMAYFKLKGRVLWTLLGKLWSGSDHDRAYVLRYFGEAIPKLVDEESDDDSNISPRPEAFIGAIAKSARSREAYVRSRISCVVGLYPKAMEGWYSRRD